MEGMALYYCFVILLAIAIPATDSSGKASCPRDKSRIVANIVYEKILPAFRKLRTEPSSICPFSLTRDMFSIQEQNKIRESTSRWGCDFCGKVFVSEMFLDKHFDNRHIDQIQDENAICLSDVCDVFRCDIVSGSSVPDYWDMALCLEDDMQELMGQCMVLADSCIPKGLTKNETNTLKGVIMDNICSFLTCSKFWNNDLETMDNQYMALYVVLSIMTGFGIIIYNFVFYNYFYSGLVDYYDPTPKVKHKMQPYKGDRRDRSPTRHVYGRTRRDVM